MAGRLDATNERWLFTRIAGLAVVGLVVAACGNGDPAAEPEPAEEREPAATAESDSDNDVEAEADTDTPVGATTSDPAELAEAQLDGTYAGTRSVTDSNFEAEPVAEREFEIFDTTCDDSGCVSQIRVIILLSGDEGQPERRDDLVVSLTGDGEGYTGTGSYEDPCPDGAGLGATVTYGIEVAPTSATRTEDGWLVTAIEGTMRVDTAPDRDCYPDGAAGLTDDDADPYQVASLTAARDEAD